MAYIYKISNDINDLVYIGQTKFSVQDRFKEHIQDSKKDLKNKFHFAMNKIGPEHFYVETLEECNINELDKKEKFWIEYYNSYYNGYNSTRGGSGNTSDKDIDYYIQYYIKNKDEKTLTQITKDLKMNTNKLRNLLDIKEIRKKDPYKVIENFSEEEKNNIIKDSLNFSITYISKKYHHDPRTIKKLLEQNNVNYKAKINNKKIPILQLDLKTNEIIKEWNSIYEAQQFYKDRHIGECVHGKRKTASGYKWIKK